MSNKVKKNAISYAIKILNYRPRSKMEISNALKNKGYAEYDIRAVISYLIELQYLDDVKFMESWIYYRLNISPRGRWIVKNELIQKGVSHQDVENHFNQFYSEENEKHCLMILIKKFLDKQHILDNPNSDEQWERFYKKMYRKGFSKSLVVEVLNQEEDN